MIDLYVYEIISANSDSKEDPVEFGLLTESGLEGGLIHADVFSEEIIIRTTQDDVCLKKVSPKIIKRIKQGSPFFLIDMKADSVTPLETAY